MRPTAVLVALAPTAPLIAPPAPPVVMEKSVVDDSHTTALPKLVRSWKAASLEEVQRTIGHSAVLPQLVASGFAAMLQDKQRPLHPASGEYSSHGFKKRLRPAVSRTMPPMMLASRKSAEKARVANSEKPARKVGLDPTIPSLLYYSVYLVVFGKMALVLLERVIG